MSAKDIPNAAVEAYRRARADADTSTVDEGIRVGLAAALPHLLPTWHTLAEKVPARLEEHAGQSVTAAAPAERAKRELDWESIMLARLVG